MHGIVCHDSSKVNATINGLIAVDLSFILVTSKFLELSNDFSFSIAIVVLLLIVAILAAIVLVTYRKLQSNDDHSKLVKCFHALCPGRHYQAQAGQRDTGTYQPCKSKNGLSS